MRHEPVPVNAQPAPFGARDRGARLAFASRSGSPILRWLTGLYFDARGSVSRPKLLFTVALFDVLAVTAAGLMSIAIVHGAALPGGRDMIQSVSLALLVSAVLHWQWSYSVPSLRRLTPQILKVATSVLAAFVAVSGLAYVFDVSFASPRLLSVWMAVAIPLLCAVRWMTASAVENLTQSGSLVRKTVIVGGGKEADELMQELASQKSRHLNILGVFDDRQDARATEGNGAIAKLGTFAQLSKFCRDEGVDLLIVTVPQRAEERLMQILQKLFVLQVDIRVSALNSKLRLNSSAYTYIGKVPMLAVMDKPLSDWDRAVKNVEDRALGLALFAIAAPVMALVALAVSLDSRGPVFFRQKRYGFNNELIEVYKFRSMYTDRADVTASKLVTRDDPRVTRVGRIIRRTSLDELPQLLNVLKGEMALVGPRPHATQAKAESDLYEDVVQGYFSRHRVKPGVTGWAQINGWRGETDTHGKLQRRVEHDLYYIDNWSVLFDLYIVAMTPFSLITGKNAY